jgi:hypothetical protein
VGVAAVLVDRGKKIDEPVSRVSSREDLVGPLLGRHSAGPVTR